MARITNVTPECTSITELSICLKPLIRKMYQSYGIMYPDYIYVSFPHCATTDYTYLCNVITIIDLWHEQDSSWHYRN